MPVHLGVMENFVMKVRLMVSVLVVRLTRTGRLFPLPIKGNNTIICMVQKRWIVIAQTLLMKEKTSFTNR